MRSPAGALIFIALFLLLDTYVFQAIKSVTVASGHRSRMVVYGIYWLLTLLTLCGFVLFISTGPGFLPKNVRTYLFAIIIGLFLAKFAAIFFILVDDLRRLVTYVTLNFFYGGKNEPAMGADGISRSVFLSWLGLAAGGGVFTTLLYGFNNIYRYNVKNVKLFFDNLPAGFRGMRVVQISDIHSGSFTHKKSVEQGLALIKAQNPDLILFTGDLVNNLAEEMDGFRELFGSLKAPLGVYSVLGNHDYGDYVRWPNKGITQAENLELLKKLQADMGWRLLLNEHVELQRNGDRIALIGIENWSSKARFPKYGKLGKAYAGAENYPFKILMSHDPSHWDAEVRKNYPNIDLTLSGHTHGMQFGIDVPGFRWSPVQYIYRQWAGLYEEAKQKLYVNVGFGFIGYPGRVGVLPEITVIELA
jgi:predicted MPP superfamily phosphohydrolase